MSRQWTDAALGGGKIRARFKKNDIESSFVTHQPHTQESDSLPRKKLRMKQKRSVHTNSVSDHTAEALSDCAKEESIACGFERNKLKQKEPRDGAELSEKCKQGSQKMEPSEDQPETLEGVSCSLLRKKKRKRQPTSVSPGLPLTVPTANVSQDTDSGAAAGGSPHARIPQRSPVPSSAVSTAATGEDDFKCGVSSGAGRDEERKKDGGEESLADVVDLIKNRKKKRKRRDCWDVATISEQKSHLLQRLQDSRDQMSKSQLKRLKARLSLLTKAERGEVLVGGQLAQSEKRKKLLEKVKKKKEERDKAALHGVAEKRPRWTSNRKRREDDRDRTDARGGLAKEKRIKKICLNCRRRGHLLENCPAAVSADRAYEPDKEASAATARSQKASHPTMSGVCFNCGSREHTLKNCRKPKRPDGVLPFVLCFVCGKGGHLSSQCPDSKTGKYPKGGGCRTCGSIFHLQAECPEFKDHQATRVAAGGDARRLSDTTAGSRRGPRQPKSASVPAKVSRRADHEVDPDEYWGM